MRRGIIEKKEKHIPMALLTSHLHGTEDRGSWICRDRIATHSLGDFFLIRQKEGDLFAAGGEGQTYKTTKPLAKQEGLCFFDLVLVGFFAPTF